MQSGVSETRARLQQDAPAEGLAPGRWGEVIPPVSSGRVSGGPGAGSLHPEALGCMADLLSAVPSSQPSHLGPFKSLQLSPGISQLGQPEVRAALRIQSSDLGQDTWKQGLLR